MGEVIALVIGIMGVAGVLFTALRYRRDDTTAVIGQQQILFDEMRGITDNLRTERDEARVALADCMGVRDGRV